MFCLRQLYRSNHHWWWLESNANLSIIDNFFIKNLGNSTKKLYQNNPSMFFSSLRSNLIENHFLKYIFTAIHCLLEIHINKKPASSPQLTGFSIIKEITHERADHCEYLDKFRD